MARINIVNADNKIESNPRRAYFKLKNTGGPKGDTGAQGPQGPKGDTGAQGPAGLSASVTVGSTTTLAPGASATVTNSGDTRNAVLNFGIPTGAQGPQGVQGPKGDTGPEGAKGAKGDTGAAATVTVNATNTGAPGSNAEVVNLGDEYNAVLNFTIPRGDKGETGATGEQGPAGKDFTPTVVTALPETGENGVLYMTEKAHTTQTATGNPITATITDGAGKMESFQLDGDTGQQAYTGKNMLNINAIFPAGTTQTGMGGDVSVTFNSDGSITLDGTQSASNISLTGNADDLKIPVDTSKTYKFVIESQSGSMSPTTGTILAYDCRYNNGSSVYYRNVPFDGTSGTKTIDVTGTEYITRVRIYRNIGTQGNATYDKLKVRIALYESTESDTYEPYTGGQPSPNPDYPQPVQTVTGTQTVNIRSKNWFNYTVWDTAGKTVLRANAVTIENPTGNTLKLTNKIKQVNNFAAIEIANSKLLLGKTATISAKFKNSTVPNTKIALYWGTANNVGNQIVGQDYSGESGFAQVTGNIPATFPSGADRIRAVIYANGGASDSIGEVGTSVEWSNIQLELSSTASTYVPYASTDFPLDLGYIELCKLDTYQDYIWKDGEDWKVHKATASYTFNGSEDEGWARYTGQTTYWGFYIPMPEVLSASPSFANIGQNAPGANPWTGGKNTYRITPTNNLAFALVERNGDLMTLPEWQSFLAGENMIVKLALIIPTDTTITDANLIAQLEAIRTALLQNGANTITNTATSPNLAGDMEIGYYGYTPSSQYDKWLWLDVGAAGAHYEQI